jgi:hypothetical protein
VAIFHLASVHSMSLWSVADFPPEKVIEATAVEVDVADELTPELVAEIQKGESCQHCKGRHARACPRVKRLDFHPNGALKRVDFWAEGKWSDEHIIWPEDETMT